MCKEDIREGRKKFSRVSTVLAANGVSTPLVGFSANRTHLSISSVSPGVIFAPGEADATGFGAYQTQAGVSQFEFDVETHGDVVTKPWNCSGAGGARNVLVIETFWEDS